MVLCRTIRGAILHYISSTKMLLNSTSSGSLARKEPLKGLNRFFVRQWCYIAPYQPKEPLKNRWRTIQELYSPSVMPNNRWRTTEAPRFGATQHQKLFPMIMSQKPLLVLYNTIFFECMLYAQISDKSYEYLRGLMRSILLQSCWSMVMGQ